ncbi:TetR/AcrR family transcriptional regulator C-terminal domain-containing protein [Pseudonocardia sp. N23]|uniref:TetR/AcrR family transcriptional regulator C-terminal domain-containing protein n=1 Tax=Pseudonocardia sp. N23 TaxID=1987376 RepID=UPI000BFC96DF|nr:TetR/AcrR family transcriptional regulator C-terminal domain-containing protein [Pseudonocardia sp. N23]GAY10504.1 transcriptional regulator, GntR family/transcriptional regulator, tetr family [Pseudonocardia sp. N23]
MAASSAEIAAQLRARIRSGELAAGARVPSTREIVRRHGVAMATATKVLTALRQEGLVEARPGVGTVVAGATAPVRGTRAGTPTGRTTDGALDRRAIVAVAVAVADAEGLDALSMRRLAAALGVATMSLYHHVADKDDLVLGMLDLALGEIPVPATVPADLRAGLETGARLMWTVFRRHPWAAPAMSLTRPQAIPSGLHYTEWMLGVLDHRGLGHDTAFTAHLTLINYTRGTAVNLEPERVAQAETGLDSEAWMEANENSLRALLDRGDFPRFARMLDVEYDLDLDELFEFGLQALLDGMVPMLERAAT